MTDVWFTDKEREQLCISADCSEHADGDGPCDIPESPELVGDVSNKMGLSNVSPLEATAEVVYSNE